MKMIRNFSALIFVIIIMVVPSHCFGMFSIEDVSKSRAKALGVTFQTNTNGEAGIQVRLEFNTRGELKKITYVELQIGEGESRIVSAPLQVFYPSPKTGLVRFSAYPAYLPKSTLTIVVYGGPKGDVGYRFKVEDFTEPSQLR
jgi:hypothetical protein